MFFLVAPGQGRRGGTRSHPWTAWAVGAAVLAGPAPPQDVAGLLLQAQGMRRAVATV